MEVNHRANITSNSINRYTRHGDKALYELKKKIAFLCFLITFPIVKRKAMEERKRGKSSLNECLSP